MQQAVAVLIVGRLNAALSAVSLSYLRVQLYLHRSSCGEQYCKHT